MTPSSTAETAFVPTLPTAWATEIQSVLETGERVLAWLEPDLDSSLFFSIGVLVLTPKRILSRESSAKNWVSWPITATQSLQHRDHAGIGTIELFDGAKRLGVWRHTLGMAPAVSRLSEVFATLQRTLADPLQTVPTSAAACPTWRACSLTRSWRRRGCRDRDAGRRAPPAPCPTQRTPFLETRLRGASSWRAGGCRPRPRARKPARKHTY